MPEQATDGGDGPVGFQPADEVMADAQDGDSLTIDRYLSGELEVVRKWTTLDGVVLHLKSGGGTMYRMRAVDDDDDRLLLEKKDGKNWDRHLRVHAELV